MQRMVVEKEKQQEQDARKKQLEEQVGWWVSWVGGWVCGGQAAAGARRMHSWSLQLQEGWADGAGRVGTRSKQLKEQVGRGVSASGGWAGGGQHARSS